MKALEIAHLRAIAEVARHLHFGRAAEVLDLPPPMLTRRIQEAERLLRARLFHRTRRSVELTAAGHAFLPEALAVLEHLSRGIDVAARAERGEVGRIEVGYVGSAAYAGVLQQHIRSFRHAHPLVDIRIEEVVMDRIGPMLEAGEIDVAYCRPPMAMPDGVRTQTVHRDAFLLALPSDSPLAKAAEVHPAQLREATFVVPEQESGTLEVARRGRFSAAIGPRGGTLAAVLARVALGNSVSVVPGTLAACVSLPGVVYRPIAGKPIVSEVALAYRANEASATVREFVRHAARRAAGGQATAAGN
ncbi:LysR family transcriptional regulator [Cupriavidus plantarum]|uniref:LysR family transcriptional regulator n=1 Tax=Cupriavidus plantarum TaxID=942865 RepID=UPI001B19D1BC|nr:LysR family transcriptional regulator [Cupriavidus plantarum]CAG2128104.1 Hca operon transcriptional activator HcaR [Cupriavidus plantarum]SMR66716.1 transcriptional regulator, LysR family [Cupriavidus plantarum]